MVTGPLSLAPDNYELVNISLSPATRDQKPETRNRRPETRFMLPEDLKNSLKAKVATVDHPREMVVDVMFAIQEHYGHLTDEGVEETAQLVGMSALEVEQLATFYTFIYREPVGKFVIHVCDSVVCWMNGVETLKEYLSKKLGVGNGETTPDGLFTLLPVCCVGYCDRSPAILINKKVYGNLTTEKIDQILEKLKTEVPDGDNGLEK